MVLNASADEGSPSKRRSRDYAGWTGTAPEARSAGSSPSRSSSASFDPIAVSPPSPSSSLSISPTSASRRSSVSYPRGFQPGSPTNARSLRASVAPMHAGVSIPQPFPAAPPPHESIKLQKVPESVRTALEFRQQSAAYNNGEPMSMPEPHGFSKFGAGVLDARLPKTPVATRAPSPASPPSSRSSHSPAASRPPSRQPSRHSSREHLATLSVTPPAQSTSSSGSAFAPLFPTSLNTPPLSGPTHTRDRSRSIAVPFGSSSFALPDKASSPPTFSSSFISDASAPAGLSVSISTSSPLARRAHQASESISSGFGNAAPFQSGSRLATHRMSLAPTTGLGAPGDGTDEYAQIIMSTRNAKMRKWKGSGPAVSTLEAGTVGAGSTFVPASGEGDGVEAGDRDTAAHSETREIEWVDWLDEYRKLKEAKLRADQEGDTSPEREKAASDEDGQSTEGEGTGKGKKSPREKKPGTPSPPRRSDTFQPAEPALAAAQKGKAKATSKPRLHAEGRLLSATDVIFPGPEQRRTSIRSNRLRRRPLLSSARAS